MDSDLQALQDVRDCVKRAAAAQERLNTLSQAEVDRIVGAMCAAGEAQAESLARIAVEDTKMGRVVSKTEKNLVCTRDLWRAIKDMPTVGVVRRDDANKVYEIAEPVGVIAAIIPTTNPTSTALYKAIIALKARNAVVVSPHPRAVKCIQAALKVVYDAALSAGAPEGCIECLTRVTLEATNALMRNRDVKLILSTGGEAIVHAAYSSGTPSLGVGPGNVPVFIERTANIPTAVERILASKNFDYGTVCASEQALILDAPIRDAALTEFRKQKAYIVNAEERKKLEATVIKGSLMNPDVVGQSPVTIAKMSGFSVPEDTSILLAECGAVGREWPLSREKLCPVLAVYTEDGWRKACERCIEVLEFGGLGHTLVIHSTDERIIMEFALKKPTFRVLVNSPASQGAVGFGTGLFPAMTLGCGTYGGNITSDNISPKNLLNIKRMAVWKADPFRPSGGIVAAAVGASTVADAPLPPAPSPGAKPTEAAVCGVCPKNRTLEVMIREAVGKS